MVGSERIRWYALALLCAVQFMVVLDIAVVNVALPSIQNDLHFSQENLQWVISAYALVFGGFMLLGGRLRTFSAAGACSWRARRLLGRLAAVRARWSEASLIGARALQGLGAATITPSALSILTTTFPEGTERNIALGAWGAVGGFGAAAGVLLGGILTDLLSWQWIFFVNVPVGIAGLALAPFLLGESRDARRQEPRRAGCGPRHHRAVCSCSGSRRATAGAGRPRDDRRVRRRRGVLLAAFPARGSRGSGSRWSRSRSSGCRR